MGHSEFGWATRQYKKFLDSGNRDQGARPQKIYGRHDWTRTSDLYRVNFEVKTLKPFPYLAFPHRLASEKAPKQPSFDGELMASSLVVLHLAMRCS